MVEYSDEEVSDDEAEVSEEFSASGDVEYVSEEPSVLVGISELEEELSELMLEVSLAVTSELSEDMSEDIDNEEVSRGTVSEEIVLSVELNDSVELSGSLVESLSTLVSDEFDKSFVSDSVIFKVAESVMLLKRSVDISVDISVAVSVVLSSVVELSVELESVVLKSVVSGDNVDVSLLLLRFLRTVFSTGVDDSSAGVDDSSS